MVVFVYQGYRDTIDKFHGKFDTLEAAENHIYEDLVKEVQDFLDMMQQKKNGNYVSPITQKFKDGKEGIIERNGSEYYETTLSELEERDNQITEDGLRREKYYQNRDWKGEFKKVSQTPKGSIQQSGSWIYNNGNPPMYQGYSQRYQEGSGNYPYIVFDPSFVPPSKEMNAEYSMLGGIREEFKDAESKLGEATLKRLKKTYDNYEDRNEHMSNYMLLATFFGTDADKEEVKKIMARRNKRGYLTQKESTWLYENINPYYDHLRNVKAAETFEAESCDYCEEPVAYVSDIKEHPKCEHGQHLYCNSCIGAENDFCLLCVEGEEFEAESFNVEFNDWAKQEMLTHGEDISFKEWAQDESEKHGDMDLEDWAEHEEESHDERYGAETFDDMKINYDNRDRIFFIKSVDYDTDGEIENDELPQEFTIKIPSDYHYFDEDADEGDITDVLNEWISTETGFSTKGIVWIEEENNSWRKNAETFGAESKKTKYGMIAAGIITAFALLPEIKKRF